MSWRLSDNVEKFGMRSPLRSSLVLFVAILCAGGWAQQPELGPAPTAPDHRLLQQSQRLAALAPSAPASWFDVSNRDAVRYFYQTLLVPTDSVAMGWTGNVAGCVAGTTSQQYQTAVRRRINWFRAMAGVPAGVGLDPVLNSKDQDAALMMSSNRQLSHYPPSNWTCYTAAGAEAASRSNLCYWYGNYADPGCIALYMQDNGSNNSAVGHRRWLLYPQTETMGSGDVSETGTWPNSYPGANALWVIPSSWPPRPATRDEFVAWPRKVTCPISWSRHAGLSLTQARISVLRRSP